MTDTQSIVSISVKHSNSDEWMNVEELKLIYKALTMNLRNVFDWDKVIEANLDLGQPYIDVTKLNKS